MNARGVAVSLALLIPCLSNPATASAQEAVSASRYRLVVDAPSDDSTVRSEVDAAVIADFCRDADGCQVILLNESFDPMVVAQARLVVSRSSPIVWTTSASPTIYYVNENSYDEPVVTNTLDGTCRFSDVDANGSDTTAAFSLVAITTIGKVSCTLTLLD